MSTVPASAAKARTTRSGVSQSARKPRSTSVQSAKKVPLTEIKPRHKRRLSDPELSLTMEEDEEKENSSLDEESMTVAQLQEELRKLGAKISGRKQELLERLKEARQGRIQRFGRYDIVIVPKSDVPGEAASSGKAPSLNKLMMGKEELPAAIVVTTTTTTSSAASGKPEQSKDSGGVPVPTPSIAPGGPSGGKGPEAGSQPPAPSPPMNTSVLGSPSGAMPPVDSRSLRVQYLGKPPETIKFDMNDKFVVENVSAMLRNLFPEQKVNLDPKLDIEPIYLMDEYAELHVVTMDFLRNCPATNDPPSTIYQARKGPLSSTIEDGTLKTYHFWTSIALSLLQLFAVSLIFSPRFIFGSMPQIGTFGLFRALHDWAGFGYPASLFGASLHATAWIITCAYMAPAYRLGMKMWFPRFKALRVDAHKAYMRYSMALGRRTQKVTSRVLGYGSPITARMGLGVRANWTWLVTKRWLTSDLLGRIRSYLAEGTIVSFVCVQAGLNVESTIAVLVISFARPRLFSLRQLWQGEINAENLLSEIVFSSLAVPGFATNLATTPALGTVVGVQLVGKDESKLKIKWNPPSDVPKVSTTSEKSYAIGISRYLVMATAVDDGNSLVFGCAAPARDWFRAPRIDELVLAVTFTLQALYIHPGLGSLVAFLSLYSSFTSSTAPYKAASLTLDGLLPNTEYQVRVAAVDDLNRQGAWSSSIIFRTRPRTLFRRLLLASEEVPLNVPPKPAGQAPATGPQPAVSVSVSSSGSAVPTVTPTVTVTGGPVQSVSVTSPNGQAITAPTAVAVAFPMAPAPPAPIPSATKGHIRYAGVVWNLAMDDKETEIFLRTMRSAMLPDPRKEKFEADLVFSTESKTTHQVVSANFLRTMASSQYDPYNMWAWYKDPLLVAHPAGTRHTFAPGSIYSHMIFTQKTVDRLVLLFVSGSFLSLAYSFYEAQAAGNTGAFWQRTYVDAVRTLIQMFVGSNVMVLVLQRIKAMYTARASPVQQRIEAISREAVNSALDVVIADRSQVVARSVLLGAVSLMLCLLALWFNGPLSFTGIFFSLLILTLAATTLDATTRSVLGDALQGAAATLLAPISVLIPPFIPRPLLRLVVAGIVAALTFSVVPNTFAALLLGYAAFTFTRFTLQRV